MECRCQQFMQLKHIVGFSMSLGSRIQPIYGKLSSPRLSYRGWILEPSMSLTMCGFVC